MKGESWETGESLPGLRVGRKAFLYYKVPRLRPLVLLIRIAQKRKLTRSGGYDVHPNSSNVHVCQYEVWKAKSNNFTGN